MKVPIIVIHPGWKYYSNIGQAFMQRFDGYEQYLQRLNEYIKRARKNGRNVYVLYDNLDDRNLNKTVLDITKEIIDADVTFIKDTEKNRSKLYKNLNSDVVEICGEWNHGCVDRHERELRTRFKVKRGIVFPTEEQYRSVFSVLEKEWCENFNKLMQELSTIEE